MCGEDSVTEHSYEHRRQLIENDLLRLASIFYIDVAAFAAMSNHYHVVLHVDAEAAKNADPKEIVQKWHQLFKGKDVTRRFLDGKALEPIKLNQVDVLIYCDLNTKEPSDISTQS